MRMSRRDPTGAPARTTRCVSVAIMLTHHCLNPQDPYAEREVRVAFEWAADRPRLIAVLDEHEADILPDLVDVQRDDLRREIVAALRMQEQSRRQPVRSPAPVARDR